MRYLFVPDELTVPGLWKPATFTEEERQALQRQFDEGALPQQAIGQALTSLAVRQEHAWKQRKRYTFAVYGLFRAELLRRQCRWGEALEELTRVIPWLETRNDIDARYDEALARYLQGLIHYRLHADAEAKASLLQAARYIRQCQEDWHFRAENEKFAIGERLLRWIEALLAAQEETPPLARRAIVPLYLPPAEEPAFEVRIVPIDGNALERGDGSTVRCRSLAEGRYPPICPLCETFYFALAMKDNDLPVISQDVPDFEGDFLVMAWEGNRPLRGPDAFALRSFRRFHDGHIVWTNDDRPFLKLGGIPVMLCSIEGA